MIHGRRANMPVASPYVPKFLKYFRIRYLESRNVLSLPDRAYKAIKGKAVGPLFNLRGSTSWKRLKVRTRMSLLWKTGSEAMVECHC